MRRRRQEGSYVVTGPDKQERRVLSVAVGLSVAQNWASKRMKQEGTFTYYVRDVLGTTTYATVTKQEDGSVETWPNVVAPVRGAR